MSINFQNPMNDGTMRLAEKVFSKQLVAMDKRTILLNRRQFFQSEIKQLANSSGQVATLELNDNGDIKEMSDGTRYKATASGWKKL